MKKLVNDTDAADEDMDHDNDDDDFDPDDDQGTWMVQVASDGGRTVKAERGS